MLYSTLTLVEVAFVFDGSVSQNILIKIVVCPSDILFCNDGSVSVRLSFYNDGGVSVRYTF